MIGKVTRTIGWALLAVVTLAGCQTAYYATMEKFGYHKRDLLVSRVQDARDAQDETKTQFKSALERFNAVLGVKGGALQEKYDQLQAEYDRCDAAATNVRNRVAEVEDVAEALFKEWNAELEQYTNQQLRRDSERKLEETRRRYDQLLRAMKRAESKMDPVLAVFRDQVLYLKHNLNAQAIASLQGELGAIEANVAALIREMETSIAEADAFIHTLEKEQ